MPDALLLSGFHSRDVRWQTNLKRLFAYTRLWPTVTIAASVAVILPPVAMRWIPVLDEPR